MSRTRRLAIVLVLNLVLTTALVVVGLAAHSRVVLAAGVDYLADAAAISVSLLAIWLASRPPSRARPDCYPSATKIAALVNAGWLLVLNILIAVAAMQRLTAGSHRVDGLPVLVISGIAAAVMLAGALFLGGDDTGDDGAEDLNVRAVLLETAAAAAGVAASGAIILAAGGWYWRWSSAITPETGPRDHRCSPDIVTGQARLQPAMKSLTGPCGHKVRAIARSACGRASRSR